MTRHRRARPLLGRAALPAVLLAELTMVASCTSVVPVDRTAPAVSDYSSGLWPDRPRVELSFEVAPDLALVTGREAITFTPDAPTDHLEFRAWPNNPTMHEAGNALTVISAGVEGEPASLQVTAAGAPVGAPGTLITIPLQSRLAAGQTVHVQLHFQLTLGAGADERVGRSPETRTAWFGSGFPLLSWVRGSGWARDPAVGMNGETAVSEDFMLSELSVTAPTDFTVLGPGTSAGSVAGPTPATTTHLFTAPAVRDVAVAVGDYDVLDRDIGGVHLRLGTPTRGVRTSPEQWADQIEHAVTGLTRIFGPFPYRDLTVAITPGQTDGTEFPTALQMSDAPSDELPALVTHEVAHQWFYALVGNNQARDPWLDEALATLGEALVGGDADQYAYGSTPREVVGLMGRPMCYWVTNGGFTRYTQAVYNQGAAALLEARRRVGPDEFDAHLRAYVAANAHGVASPASFAEAFADVPAVLDLLRTAGAIPARE